MLSRLYIHPYFAIGCIIAVTPAVNSIRQNAVIKQSEGIPVSSTVGKKLLSSATLLANDSKHRDLEASNGQDLSWLPNYSVKVLGCHAVPDWNYEVDGEKDVRVMTKKLLRFRLCPERSCGSSSAMGCGGFGASYGDYIVGMDVFLLNYLDYLQEENAARCSQWADEQCGCYNDGNKFDGFNQDQCEFQCFYTYGKTDCYYDYTTDDDGYTNNFNIANYMECGEWLPPGFEGRRRLDADEGEIEEEGNDGYGDDEFEKIDGVAVKPYFIGPYCSKKGDSVFLGLFLDDTCSEFADDRGGTKVYATLTDGSEMPYSIERQLISGNCVSCGNQYDADDEKEDVNGAEEDIAMVCAAAYKGAGKCERHLNIDNPNVAACNYIDGITLVEQGASRRRSVFDRLAMILLDNPHTSLIVLGSLFGISALCAIFLRIKLAQHEFETNQQAQLIFNAAQIDNHYSDFSR